MDRDLRVGDAVASAQKAAQLTTPWAVCDGCVQRLAECPGINLKLEKGNDRQRILEAFGVDVHSRSDNTSRWYDTSSSNITWKDLRTAAERGCPLCAAVHKQVRDEVNHPERFQKLIIETLDLRDESDYMQFRLLTKDNTGDLDGYRYRHNFADAEDVVESVTVTFDRLLDVGELKILLEVFLRAGNDESATTPYTVEALHWGLFPAQGSLAFPKMK